MFNLIFKINARPMTYNLRPIITNQQGTALVVSLFMLVLITAIGITATNRTIVEGWLSANYRLSKQAFYVAEAGLEFTRNALRTVPDWTVNTAVPRDGTITVGGHNAAYTISLRNATPNSIIITSTGTITGATSVVEALFSRAFSPDGAIITNENLRISGNPTITGSNGGVHSNSNLTISGNPTIAQTASAFKNLTISGNPTIAQTIRDAPRVDIPRIDPRQFASSADYQLMSGGRVFRKGSTVPENMPGGKWHGWDYSNGKWTLSGNVAPPPGMLYIEGDAHVSGNPGSVPNPWRTTLVATGDINLSGNPIIADHKNPSDPIGVQNLLFVAGMDIKISGNPTQTFEGIIAARGHIKVSGNPNLNGCIIAENATGTQENEVSGNVTITYNGMASPFISNTVRILSWRQVHN
jgi:cytoskeletal protein CcmA (bactofilin family)